MSQVDRAKISSQDESVLEEIEALKSVFVHELEVQNNDSGQPCQVVVQLHPATADNFDAQYVRLTLILNLPSDYPNAVPEIIIRNPRGLSESEIQRLQTEMAKTANGNIGMAMMFQLIEQAKEHLTASNTPSGQCAICLYGFEKTDAFSKTPCYHHFHSHCLGRYVKTVLDSQLEDASTSTKEATEQGVVCPVCREPISYDLNILLMAPAPSAPDLDPDFRLSSEMVRQQRDMNDLFNKQKSRGGIIDLEEQKKKFLLQISQAPKQIPSPEADSNSSNSNGATSSAPTAENSSCDSTATLVCDWSEECDEITPSFDSVSPPPPPEHPPRSRGRGGDRRRQQRGGGIGSNSGFYRGRARRAGRWGDRRPSREAPFNHGDRNLRERLDTVVRLSEQPPSAPPPRFPSEVRQMQDPKPPPPMEESLPCFRKQEFPAISGFRKNNRNQIPAFRTTRVIQEPTLGAPRAFGPPPFVFKASDGAREGATLPGGPRPAFVKPKAPPGFFCGGS